MSNDKRSQQRHAIKRARERYGLTVTADDLEDLARRIRHEPPDETVTFVGRQTRRVSAYRAQLHGVEVAVLYDKHTHTVMTFLTKDAVYVD